MLDFRPPKDSPIAIGLVKLLLPLVMKVPLHDTRIQVVGDGLERFKALNGLRTVICPNHSNHDDPEVMFAFSAAVGEDFNFLAAREIFDYDHGFRGFWLQRLGCYSVVRGAVDRESFKTTRNLIVANKKKLVIFPEGEVSRQNDTLLHLESGVCQMAFWAVDELAKKQQLEPVFILPLAMKFTYPGDIRENLDKALYRIEERLGLESKARDPLYKRLSAVSGSILATLEREYNFKPAGDASVNERIAGLRLAILKNIASYLQIGLPAGLSQLEYVRILRNALDDYVYNNVEEEGTAYLKKLHNEKTAKIKGFYRDLDRVLTFIAIYDGYLRDHLTQERFAEVVDRFEMEVFGKRSIKGARLVYLDLGRPVDLLPMYADYKCNRKTAIQHATDNISEQISTMLDALDRKRPAVFVE